MNIRDGLNKVIKDGMTYHKIMNEPINLLDDDWIRIYKGKSSMVNDLIFSCDYKDTDKIPKEILDMKYDTQANWFVGGNLSVDFIIEE